jgi:hypothetical protein
MRVRRIAAAALVGVVGVLTAVVPASARTVAITVDAKPAPGSHTAPGGASWFLLQLAPGASITQQFEISNPNGFAVTADVGPVDAHTGPTTGATYSAPLTAPKLTGTWITSSVAQVQLQPGEHRLVPFTVHVPVGTKPGQYLAAMSASPPPPASVGRQVQPNHAVIQWRLRAQSAIAVEVDVPGPMAPRLVVTGVQPNARNGLVLRVHMDNRGNAFARGTGVVTVADAALRDAFPVQTFVPGTAIDFPVPWTHNVVPGRHVVNVRLEIGKSVETWTGVVNITGEMVDQAARATRSSGSRSSGLPIVWLSAIALIVCVAFALHLRRRRTKPRASRAGRSLPPRREFPSVDNGQAASPEDATARRAAAGAARRD